MVNTISDGSSSDEERDPGPDPTGRKKSLIFVWMTRKLEKTPRGKTWDELNRDGKVKEIQYNANFSSEHMKAAMRKSFPGLEKADFSRYQTFNFRYVTLMYQGM